MKSFLEHFDAYVKMGLRPVPLFSQDKNPICKDWLENWSVERWRPYFEKGNYNMGILLGSGIMDVEADCETANELLTKMIGDVPHPMFKSHKSIHHLFICPDPLLWRYVFSGIEFRGDRHQSVVPPSIHEKGNKYVWLAKTQFPIPQMPQELLDFYWRGANERREKAARREKQKFTPKQPNKPGYKHSECRACHNKFYIHEKRLVLEVKAFRAYGQPWMCHRCREFDLREDCREIRKEMERPTRYVEPYASILEDI